MKQRSHKGAEGRSICILMNGFWERDCERERKWLHDGDVLGKGDRGEGELDPRLPGPEIMIMMMRGHDDVSSFNSLLWFIWIIESTTEPNS